MSTDISFAADIIKNSAITTEIEGTGMESLNADYLTINGIEIRKVGTNLQPRYEMYHSGCGATSEGNSPDPNRLILSTDDNIFFRLYFTEVTNVDNPKYQNKFNRLLRQMNDNQTLNIHMGNSIYGNYPIFSFGNMIDSIQRTRARVITHINGRAGCAETYLWLYGSERVISEFGTLYFSGLQTTLKYSSDWYNYFKTIMDKAVELGILSEEEVITLMTSDKDLQISRSEYIARIEAATAVAASPLDDAPIVTTE